MNDLTTAFEDTSTAYAGLEDPASFPTGASLHRYRQALLARTASQAEFIIDQLPADARVLEIGCGNGRLLIELARRDGISEGLGLDVAASRIDFARTWAREEGASRIRFETADVLEYPFSERGFSAVCCITGAFGYFEVFATGAAQRLAGRIVKSLSPGGFLCLEVYPHPLHRTLLAATGGRARIWDELPSDDPWRFYLSQLSLDETGQILTHEKTFVHRTTGQIDAGRREHLVLYTEESIRLLLSRAGFAEIRVHEGWSAEPYQGGETMVVLAFAGVSGA
jgi:ubiquinone/menaquinone biosynthesis C-methylase UbiE